jgi:hypothetical protein
MTYIKLWIKPENGGRMRTMLLALLFETAQFYHGRRVNCYGEDDSFMRRDGTIVDVQQLIDKALVVKTKVLEMDKKYGLLTESLPLNDRASDDDSPACAGSNRPAHTLRT